MAEPPLLIFGLDSAEPENILRWAADGSLPTIASLLRDGTCATLSGAGVMSAHELWPTFFSGAPLEEHASYGRSVLVPGTYRFAETPAERIGAEPFWARLAGRGKSVLIVDVPHVRPVPGLDGTQIHGWGEHPTPKQAVSLPEDALGEAERVVGPRIATDERYWNAAWDRWNLRKILKRIEKKRELCVHLASRSSPELAIVVFGDTHAAGHRFSKYGGATNGAGSLAHALRDTFQAVDTAIGDLLATLPRPANVFVVSNCGIRHGDPVQKLLEVFLRRLGYLARRPATTLADRLRDLFEDDLPAWGRFMLERALPTPLHSLLDHPLETSRIEWSRTKVFLIPGTYTGYLRVNLKGREPEGIVEPGEEYEKLLHAVERDFRELVDPATGEPVVEDVLRSNHRGTGGIPSNLPDLFVHWRSHAKPYRRLAHPRLTLEQPFLAGRRANRHSREGLIIASGPDIARSGTVDPRSPLEFAPLFLRLLGEASTDAVLPSVRAAFLRST